MNKSLVLFVLYLSLISCSPKLTFIEMQERVSSDYTAFNEGDVEYEINNLPNGYIKEYGEKGLREKLNKIYGNRTYPLYYNGIGGIHIQERNKCNSTYYYKVKFNVYRNQMTPYIDSIALERNYKLYGKENVSFDSNSKMLKIKKTVEKILINDKSNKWIVLDYNDSKMQYLNRYYNKNFSECLESNIENSDYLFFW